MLYIFNMNTGKMLTFEMGLAVERCVSNPYSCGCKQAFNMRICHFSVQSLMQAIENQYAIPASSQVLLVSGGEALDRTNRVCSYSAGTDTNPIFMFSMNLESKNLPAPWPSIDNGKNSERVACVNFACPWTADTDVFASFVLENDLKTEVDKCLELPANYNTVVRRATLAQQFYEMGKDELKLCDKLVQEQHLQHQGWMSVVANMEDITAEFRERCRNFGTVFQDHIERRMEYEEYLGR